MNERDRPFDSGLQPERTSLAWQRTSLALGIAALLAARLVAEHAWWAAVAFAAAGITAIVSLLVATRRRYRRVHRALSASPSGAVPSGAFSFLALASVATLIALAAMLAIGMHLL